MGHKNRAKITQLRNDRYYRLAKETGYRSRAAFKLIQLNRKFSFLQKSRVLIDLCAAPGGWMQVAKQNMPVSSIVIGVDLFPIPAISGCLSFQADITTSKCVALLQKELQTWKADVVLNDGAPNVGTNWLFDAYQQACLTLSALKVATKFLKPGGWFITKVFRSKDYHPLLWVFKQMFKQVHSTKPQASRKESAEIFVVCQYYLAPDKLDPRFLDPKYVFEELEIEPKQKLTILHPDKKKVKPAGYAAGDHTLYHKIPISKFISADDYLQILQNASEFVFDDERMENHPKTTPEIKECFKDIKVLGRKDIRNILNWRKAVKADLEKKDEEEAKEEGDEDEKTEEDKELAEIEKQLAEFKAEEAKKLKRKKKKVREEKKKIQDKLNLKMILKGDPGPQLEESGIFELKNVDSIQKLKQLLDQTPDTLPESDEEGGEKEPKQKVVKYDVDISHLDSSGLFYKDSESELEFSEDEDDDSVNEKEGLDFSENEDDEPPAKRQAMSKVEEELSDDESEDEIVNEEGLKEKDPLITDLDYRRKKEKKWNRAELWFERDAFNDLEEEADEDYELDMLTEEYRQQGGRVIGEEKKQQSEESDSDSESEHYVDVKPEKEKKAKKGKKPKEDKAKKDEKLKEKNGETDAKAAAGPGGEVKKKKKVKLDFEAMALGSIIVQSNKTKRDIADAGWNRYSYGDEDLPEWFVNDEKIHMRPDLPVPQDLILEYKNKLKEINTRSMKKVIEAKARKKKRLVKRLENAKEKASGIMENLDISQREKARQLKQLYKKAAEKKKKVQYIVARKFSAAKRISRPRGMKGPYRVVDPRMKKDKDRKAEKKTKKGKKK